MSTPKKYGKSKYEIGLYKNGHLFQVYRTDTIEGIPILLNFAESYAEYLGIEKTIKSCQEEVFNNFEEIEPG